MRKGVLMVILVLLALLILLVMVKGCEAAEIAAKTDPGYIDIVQKFATTFVVIVILGIVALLVGIFAAIFCDKYRREENTRRGREIEKETGWKTGVGRISFKEEHDD